MAADASTSDYLAPPSKVVQVKVTHITVRFINISVS